MKKSEMQDILRQIKTKIHTSGGVVDHHLLLKMREALDVFQEIMTEALDEESLEAEILMLDSIVADWSWDPEGNYSSIFWSVMADVVEEGTKIVLPIAKEVAMGVLKSAISGL